MKKNLLKTKRIMLLAYVLIGLTNINLSAQNYEKIKGGSMEKADEGSWTVNFTGAAVSPTLEFGSSETCEYGKDGSLLIEYTGEEYANLIISQEVTLSPNTTYIANGAIKDLTGGALANFWAQLKLKANVAPNGENDGIKLMGYNSWMGCNPDDDLWKDKACDAFGKNKGEEPVLYLQDDFGNFLGIANFKTPDTSLTELVYHFAIVMGLYTTSGTPLSYEIAIDEISLIDSVAYANPDAIYDNDFNNTVDFYNYPNPFNGLTNISYNINKTSNVKLNVYNLLGEEISCLYNGKENPGTHTVLFDASNIKSNILICKLEVDNKVIVRKMILIK